jgi:hypothetical protein
MKKNGLALLAIIAFSGCKDEIEVANFQSLIGKWQMVAYEHIKEDGGKIWVDVGQDSDTGIGIWFREDEAVLSLDGKTPRCPPEAYYLNGTLLKTSLPDDEDSNPICMAALCAPCKAIHLEQKGDTLIASGCSAGRVRYIRQ